MEIINSIHSILKGILYEQRSKKKQIDSLLDSKKIVIIGIESENKEICMMKAFTKKDLAYKILGLKVKIQ